MTDQDHFQHKQKKRPKIVTILAVLAMLFTCFHLFRFSQIVLQRTTLAGLALQIPPGWLSSFSVFWSTVGLLLSFSLWTGKVWAPVLAAISGFGLSISHWINLVFFVEIPILPARLPAHLIFNLLWLGLLVLILNLKSTRIYFGRNPVKIP